MAFNVNVDVKLRGPQNINQIAQEISSKIGNIQANVNLNFNAGSLSQLQQLASGLQQANSGLQNFSSSMRQIGQTNLTNIGTASQNIGQLNNATSNGISTLRQYASALSNTASEAYLFGEQMGLATRRFLAFTIGAGSLLSSLYAISRGFKEAIDFQNELVKFGQIGNDLQSSIRGIGQEIGNLAKTYGVSSNELIRSTNILRQAGLTAEQTGQALRTLAQAASSPNFDTMEASAQTAIAVMNQFNISAGQLNNSFSSINAVAANFAVSSRDIQDAIQRSGGSFASLGGNLNEFIAVFTSVKNTTQESSEAVATGLRTIFTRLQRQDTVDALKDLGVQLRYTREQAQAIGNINLTNQFVGAFPAIQKIGQALRDIPATDPRYEKILETIGGSRQFSRSLPLFQRQDIQQRSLDIANVSQNNLALTADRAQESLLRRTTAVIENFKELFRVIVGSPAFESLAKNFLIAADAVATFGKYLAPILPLVTALAGIKAFDFLKDASKGFADKIFDPRKGIGLDYQKRTFASGGFASAGLAHVQSGEAIIPNGVYSPPSDRISYVPGDLTATQDNVLANLPNAFVLRKSVAQRPEVKARLLGGYAHGDYVPTDLFNSLNSGKAYSFNRLINNDDLIQNIVRSKSKKTGIDFSQLLGSQSISARHGLVDEHGGASYYENASTQIALNTAKIPDVKSLKHVLFHELGHAADYYLGDKEARKYGYKYNIENYVPLYSSFPFVNRKIGPYLDPLQANESYGDNEYTRRPSERFAEMFAATLGHGPLIYKNNLDVKEAKDYFREELFPKLPQYKFADGGSYDPEKTWHKNIGRLSQNKKIVLPPEITETLLPKGQITGNLKEVIYPNPSDVATKLQRSGFAGGGIFDKIKNLFGYTPIAQRAENIPTAIPFGIPVASIAPPLPTANLAPPLPVNLPTAKLYNNEYYPLPKNISDPSNLPKVISEALEVKQKSGINLKGIADVLTSDVDINFFKKLASVASSLPENELEDLARIQKSGKVDIFKPSSIESQNFIKGSFANTIKNLNQFGSKFGLTDILNTNLASVPQLRQLSLKNPEDFQKAVGDIELYLQQASNYGEAFPQASSIIQSKFQELNQLKKSVTDFQSVPFEDVKVLAPNYGKKGNRAALIQQITSQLQSVVGGDLYNKLSNPEVKTEYLESEQQKIVQELVNSGGYTEKYIKGLLSKSKKGLGLAAGGYGEANAMIMSGEAIIPRSHFAAFGGLAGLYSLNANGNLPVKHNGGFMGDEQLVKAQAGEYIIKKPIVDAYGAGAFHELNKTGSLKGFAYGDNFGSTKKNPLEYIAKQAELKARQLEKDQAQAVASIIGEANLSVSGGPNALITRPSEYDLYQGSNIIPFPNAAPIPNIPQAAKGRPGSKNYQPAEENYFEKRQEYQNSVFKLLSKQAIPGSQANSNFQITESLRGNVPPLYQGQSAGIFDISTTGNPLSQAGQAPTGSRYAVLPREEDKAVLVKNFIEANKGGQPRYGGYLLRPGEDPLALPGTEGTPPRRSIVRPTPYQPTGPYDSPIGPPVAQVEPFRLRYILENQKQLEAALRKQVDATNNEATLGDKSVEVQRRILQLKNEAAQHFDVQNRITQLQSRQASIERIGIPANVREEYLNNNNELNVLLKKEIDLRKNLTFKQNKAGEFTQVSGENVDLGFFGNLRRRARGIVDNPVAAQLALGTVAAYAGQGLSSYAGTADQASELGRGNAYIGSRFLQGAVAGGSTGAAVGSIVGPKGIAIGAVAGATYGGIQGGIEASKELRIADSQLALNRLNISFTNLSQSAERLNGVLTNTQITRLGQINNQRFNEANTLYREQNGLTPGGRLFSSIPTPFNLTRLAFNTGSELYEGQGFGNAIERAGAYSLGGLADIIRPGSAQRSLNRTELPEARQRRLSSLARQNPQIIADENRLIESFLQNQLSLNPNSSTASLTTAVQNEFRNRPGLALAANQNNFNSIEAYLQSDVFQSTVAANRNQSVLRGGNSQTGELEFGFKRFVDQLNHSSIALEQFNNKVASTTSLVLGGNQLSTRDGRGEIFSRPLDTLTYRNTVAETASGLGGVAGQSLTDIGLTLGRLGSVTPELLRQYTRGNSELSNAFDSGENRVGRSGSFVNTVSGALGFSNGSIGSLITQQITDRLVSLAGQRANEVRNSPFAAEELVTQELAKYAQPLANIYQQRNQLANQTIVAEQQILNLVLKQVDYAGRSAEINTELVQIRERQRASASGQPELSALNITANQANAGFNARINSLGRGDFSSNTSVGNLRQQAQQLLGEINQRRNSSLITPEASRELTLLEGQFTRVRSALELYTQSTQRASLAQEQLNLLNRDRSSRIEGQRRFILGSDEDRTDLNIGANIQRFIESSANRQQAFNNLPNASQQLFLRYSDTFSNVRIPGTNTTIGGRATELVGGQIPGDAISSFETQQTQLLGQIEEVYNSAREAAEALQEITRGQEDTVRSQSTIQNTTALTNLTQSVDQLTTSIVRQQLNNAAGNNANVGAAINGRSGSQLQEIQRTLGAYGFNINDLTDSTNVNDLINRISNSENLGSQSGLFSRGNRTNAGQAVDFLNNIRQEQAVVPFVPFNSPPPNVSSSYYTNGRYNGPQINTNGIPTSPTLNFIAPAQTGVTNYLEESLSALDVFGISRYLRGFNKGGVVYANTGQSIFKPQGTDTIPAMLTEGEFVINAESTRHNEALIRRINQARAPLSVADLSGSIRSNIQYEGPRYQGGNEHRWDDNIRTPNFYASRGGIAYLADGGRPDFDLAEYLRNLNNNNGIATPATPTPTTLDGAGVNPNPYGDSRLTPRVFASNPVDDFVGPSREGTDSGLAAAARARGVTLPQEQAAIDRLRDQELLYAGENRLRQFGYELPNERAARLRREATNNVATTRTPSADETTFNILARNSANNAFYTNAELNNNSLESIANNFQRNQQRSAYFERILSSNQTGGQAAAIQRQQAAAFEARAIQSRQDQFLRPRFGDPRRNVFAALQPRARRFEDGGHVTGPAGGDVIPAYLSNGEYVLNRNSTNAIGIGTLDRIQRFANGGAVNNSGNVGGAAFGIGDTTELQNALLNFSQENSKLTDALLTFGRNSSDLVEAMNNFPRELSISGTQEISVLINGADVLARIEPSIKELVDSSIEKALQDMIKSKFPDNL